MHDAADKPQKTIIINDVIYFKGLNIICRKPIRIKKQKLFINFSYEIIHFDSTSITLLDKLTEEKFVLDHSQLKYFSLGYCMTGHASQGLTIPGKISIFDVDCRYASREWFYTAITRTTNLKNVYIYLPDEKASILQQLKTIITERIGHHKLSDVKRPYREEDYVDVKWVLKELTRTQNFCEECHQNYDLLSNTIYQFSIDRVDNDRAHVKDNCRIICRICNISKKNTHH